VSGVIYAGLVEGYAAEISARRNAMENASKNAVSCRPAPDRGFGQTGGAGRQLTAFLDAFSMALRRAEISAA
jgi:catabolite regulation protein CreA